jgi:hypothetical protein
MHPLAGLLGENLRNDPERLLERVQDGELSPEFMEAWAHFFTRFGSRVRWRWMWPIPRYADAPPPLRVRRGTHRPEEAVQDQPLGATLILLEPSRGKLQEPQCVTGWRRFEDGGVTRVCGRPQVRPIGHSCRRGWRERRTFGMRQHKNSTRRCSLPPNQSRRCQPKIASQA